MCHPFLPYTFGTCTSSLPYRIVLQFHGVNSETITISKELLDGTPRFPNPVTWFLFCSQLLEAMQYLHDNVQILHNDIKGDYILIADATSCTSYSSSDVRIFQYHIVLTDFGKATTVSSARRYTLSEPEKVQYLVKYPHIAPEVVHGETKQSSYSDMFAVGRVFSKFSDQACFQGLPKKDVKELLSLINRLTSLVWHKRPTAEYCLEVMDKLLL